ncbi:hypothetical protein F5146DRAFT_1147171 [Armillaria mellea]|nr:hypothetical protein F5146DRAFT_1147171 [Armillaria mellea]
MPNSTRHTDLDRNIRNQLQELIHEAEPELTPVLPTNHIPHPLALNHTSEYLPLPSNVATTLYHYLCDSLYHPAVTSHEKFHAVVLKSKHALQLEPNNFQGLRIHRTHAFDTTLSKLQGPDGLPVASRAGHAVVIFFPKNDTHKFSNRRNNHIPDNLWVRAEDTSSCGRPPSSPGRDDESICSSSNEKPASHEDRCLTLDIANSHPQAEPRLSSLEAVKGSTMPPTFESSEDSEDEGGTKEERLVHPAVHPSVIRARQILWTPGIQNTPWTSVPSPNKQLFLPPVFAIMVT